MSEKYTAQLRIILAEQMNSRMFQRERHVLAHVIEAIRMSCDLIREPQSEWQGFVQSVGVERASSNLDLVGDITIYKITIE